MILSEIYLDLLNLKKYEINLLNIKGIGAFHLQGFDQFERYLPAVIEEENF